jgi:FKBP-type peptidyl-prolyl cis-trans isomerase
MLEGRKSNNNCNGKNKSKDNRRSFDCAWHADARHTPLRMTAETNTKAKAKAKAKAKTKTKAKAKAKAKAKTKAKTTAGPSTAHGTLTRAMLRSG